MQCFESWHEFSGTIKIAFFVCGLIDLTQEPYGRGNDGLLIVYLKLREVESVLHIDVGSGLEVIE